MDDYWENSGCHNPIIRIADASITYNCFAYALGYTNWWINDIRYFAETRYGPSPPGTPDWRALQRGEYADRATHGRKYGEHASIITWEPRTALIFGYPFTFQMAVYTGKYGQYGVYKGDTEEAPEAAFATAHTRNLKNTR